MKFKRGAQQEELALNITPLIDVVFLLLIFFMVGTSFNRENLIEVTLPRANAQSLEASPARLDVMVDRAGNYLVNGTRLAENSPETLSAALERASGGDNSLPVVLAADGGATHQAVVTAIESISHAGFASLRIATRDNPPD